MPKKVAPPRQRLPAGLRTLHQGVPSDLTARCDEVVRGGLRVTPDEARYVEETTRLQSNSLVWYEQRAGRITSSVVHQVLHTNHTHPSQSLIRRICSDTPSKLNVPAIKWGREHESVARQEYLGGLVKGGHADATVRETGLFICQTEPYLAASPDGLVTCSCHGTGLLEVKCPYKFRSTTANEMVKDSSSCLDVAFILKKDHEYYAQVPHQMLVTDTSYL